MGLLKGVAASSRVNSKSSDLSARRNTKVQRPGTAVSARREDPAFEELCNWVDFFQGHVHPKLDLAITALGCRGVITKDVLSEDDQAELPCIAVPDSIAISQMLANAKLLERFDSLGLTGVNELSAEMQMALFLAAEKALGSNSRYHPYIMTMPADPPCGFLMGDAALTQQLQRMMEDAEVARAVAAVRTAGAMYDQEIAEVEDMMDALSLNETDVRWALGQTLSRSFGAGVSPIMVPVVDCANHSGATVPPLTITNDDGKKLTCVSNFDTDFVVTELAAGEEVFVSYAPRGGQFDSTPLQMLIDYGFVPDEMLEGGLVPAGDDEDFDM